MEIWMYNECDSLTSRYKREVDMPLKSITHPIFHWYNHKAIQL